MKKIKLMLITSLLILIVFCNNSYLVDASGNTDNLEAIRAYATQVDRIEMFYADTEDLSVGLLNYNNNCVPALVVFYRPLDAIFECLRMQIYTYENEKLELKFTDDNEIDSFNETRDIFSIMIDVNGVDYIKHIDKGHYYAVSSAQNNAYEDIYIRKFDGKDLKYFKSSLDNSATKSDFDTFMSTLKEKQKLVSQDLEEIVDYTNKGKDIFAALTPALYLNYTRIDIDPVNINGRNLVPLRALTEAMGATVEWNGKNQGITINKDNTVVKLTLNSKYASVNDKPVDLDVPATSINGTTFVPVRFIAESFGYDVDWSDRAKTMDVYDFYIDTIE